MVSISTDGGEEVRRPTPKRGRNARREGVTALFDRQKSICKVRAEGGQLRLALAGSFELLLFPDVVVVAIERDPGAEVSVDKIGGLGENSKCVWGDGSKKSRAVPSSNADVIGIDGKSDEFEVERENTLKERGLFGSDVHRIFS